MTQLIVTLDNSLKFTDDRDRTWSIAGRRDPVANKYARQDTESADVGVTVAEVFVDALNARM